MVFQRRSDLEKVKVGDFFDSNKRYYDQVQELTIIKLYSGEFFVADSPKHMIMTILGSCISACIRDPKLKIGGMNHFLLPSTSDVNITSGSAEGARFGAFAMEQLINTLLSFGAKKERLEVKVFGGGNVTSLSTMIGDKNVAFIRKFLANEGLVIASEHLGGTQPRRVHYFPDTGKVMVRVLNRQEDMRIVDLEKKYEHTIVQKPVEGDVELF